MGMQIIRAFYGKEVDNVDSELVSVLHKLGIIAMWILGRQLSRFYDIIMGILAGFVIFYHDDSFTKFTYAASQILYFMCISSFIIFTTCFYYLMKS